jgi:hypothetical protein
LPGLDVYSLDLAEMGVTGGDRQIVLESQRADPDIVFGYRTSGFTQLVLDPPVVPGSSAVVHEYGAISCEIGHPVKVFLYSS